MQVYWSENGELVSIACEDTFYVLRFSRENYVAAVQADQVEDDGVEAAFEVVTDINERQATLLLPIHNANTFQRTNWRMGWGLLHLHQQHEPSELPCW